MWFIGSLTFLLFLLIPEFLNSDSYNKHPVLFSSLIGLSTCVITAIIVLYLQRLYRNKKLLNYYLKISGEYIRTDIGQDNTPTERLADIKKQNIGLIIVLSYQSENSFCVDISYWKDDIAKAYSIIEFNETNKVMASGTYKYYQGDNFKDHFGTLELFRFGQDSNILYVKYQHIFPRTTEYNPDNNRGWEIWEKKTNT